MPITGYDGFKFGMSFDDALAVVPVQSFDAASLRNCMADLAIRGCFLSQDNQALPPIKSAGIAYHVQLSFNRLDHLTDVTLRFSRDHGVSRDECLDIYARTLDWLSDSYGPFEPSTFKDASPGWRWPKFRTPAGRRYTVGYAPDGNFIAEPLRNVGRSQSSARIKPITKWDGDRYVDVFATYIAGCDVTAEFSEPESVERRREAAEERPPVHATFAHTGPHNR